MENVHDMLYEKASYKTMQISSFEKLYMHRLEEF